MNNTYKVIWEKKALKQLEKLNKNIRDEINDKVKNYLALDPHGLGERYAGDLKGFWKYRVRDYRIRYVIYESEIVISIFDVDNRKDCYKRK